MSVLKEFKEFAVKGNVIDMAVGIVIGAAFGTIVKSLVDDVIMPPIGLLLGNVDFQNMFLVLKDGTPPHPYANLDAAKAAGAGASRFNRLICLISIKIANATITKFMIVLKNTP